MDNRTDFMIVGCPDHVGFAALAAAISHCTRFPLAMATVGVGEIDSPSEEKELTKGPNSIIIDSIIPSSISNMEDDWSGFCDPPEPKEMGFKQKHKFENGVCLDENAHIPQWVKKRGNKWKK